MIVLDTDHLSVLTLPQDARHNGLVTRLSSADQGPVVTTVVNLEEQLRGWLAYIHRITDVRKQVQAYERLAAVIEFFAEWEVLSFDLPAAVKCLELKRARIRIGSMDLKIAAVTLLHDGLLLSANLQHFGQVPGLRVENWLQ